MSRRTAATNIRLSGTVPIGIDPLPERDQRDGPPPVSERTWFGLSLIAAVAYVPLLASRPGRLVLDTYDRLHLDPAATMRAAADRWDPIAALGSLADRTYDHTFPMSPWFWFADVIGVPDWVAHRLWAGTLVMLAGAGVVFLLRTMSWTGRGWMLGALTYQCSPYVLSYVGTDSTVLVTWAALPWLISFTMRSLVERDWRSPAFCALIFGFAAAGNIPATLYLSIACGAWFVYAVVAARDVDWRDALAAAARIACLCALVSLWWITSLLADAGQAFDAIRTNDPVEVVEVSSPVSEVARGLGDWRLYSDDPTAAIAAGDGLQRSPWLIAVGFALPVIALAALIRIRFHYRLYFVALYAIGTILAVGTYSRGDGEPFARMMRAIVTSGAGALTNPGHRAVPLVWLSVAVGTAAAVRRMCELAPKSAGVTRLAVGALALMAALPLIRGAALDGSRAVEDGIPQYWQEAAQLVNSYESTQNILELPGLQQVNYTWGSTNQPVSYSLFDRPVAVAAPGLAADTGTEALLHELDLRIQRGQLTGPAMTTIAQLLSADTIVVRADARGDTGRTAAVRDLLEDSPFVEHQEDFGITATGEAALSIYRLAVPERIRTVSPDRLVALAGSPAGVLDLVETSVVAAALPPAGENDGSTIEEAAESEGTEQIAVDGNSLIVDADGLTAADFERGSVVDATPFVLSDSSRPVITDRYSSNAASSVQLPQTGPDVVWDGVRAIGALSPDGDPDAPIDPTHRLAMAFDDDPTTSWLTGVGASPVGDSLNLVLDEPTAATSLTLAQPDDPTLARRITGVRLVFDSFQALDVSLDDRSTGPVGQRIPLDGIDAFRSLSVIVTEVADGDDDLGAGFSAVDVGGVDPREVVRLPDTLGRFDGRAESNPVIVSLSRWRSADGSGVDPERTFRRQFPVDRERTPTVRVVVSGDPGNEPRDDLVEIDGQALCLISEEASGFESEFELGEGLVGMRPCDPDGQILALGSAEELVQVATKEPPGDPGRPLVERVILRALDRDVPTPSDPPPALVERNNRNDVTVTMPEGTGSVWLTHGVSADSGWSATLDEGGLSSPLSANGYALSWPISITDGLAHSVDIRWTPQRPIKVTVVVCAAGFLVVLAVALRPRRSRATPAPPNVTVPRRYIHPLVVVIVSLGVFGLTAGPIPGIVAGLTALLLEQRPHLFDRAAWVPPILLAGAGLGRALWQVIDQPPPGPAWPASAHLIDVMTWIAIAVGVAMAMANSDQRPSIRPPIQTRAIRSRR